MKKNIITLLGVILALFGLNSCLESESVISVKKDGSGTITENISIGAQMAAMMQMGAGQGGEGAEDPFASFNEEALAQKSGDYGEGVEFVSVKREDDNGKIKIVALYKFADIRKVTFKPGAMMNDNSGEEEEEEGQMDQAIRFTMEDGELTILTPAPDGAQLGFGGDDMGDDEMAMAAPMLAGMKISAKVVVADGIEETNATHREGDTITLMDINFDELMKNEGGLKAMKALDSDDRAEVAEAATKVLGVDMETQEKVTVKFK